MTSATYFVVPLLAFIISLLLLPVLIRILTRWELYDLAKDHKIHESFTPSIGGLAIYAGLLIALLVGMPLAEWLKLKFFFIAVSLMFIIGLRDDILSLSPMKKLIGQFLPIIILVVFDQTIIDGSVFFHTHSYLPEWATVLLTFIAIVLITNSYNLIDGLDGLAGSIGVICLLVFGVWFYFAGSIYLSLIALCTVGSIMAFLIFNWQPSKIFMGDTGSLLIGLMLSYYAIQFLNLNQDIPINHPVKVQGAIGVLICILIIPVLDTTRVVIYRLRKGLSPFRADKNHIHHQFLKLGLSHSKSVLSIAFINLAFVLLGLLLRRQPDMLILPIVGILCLMINFGLKWAQKKAGVEPKVV